MTTSVITRRLLGLGLVAFSLTAMAEAYKAGDSFIGFKAADQKGQPFTFKPGNIKFIIFDTPEGSSNSPKEADWFEKRHALMVVNLSEFSGLKLRIARSRAAAKPFGLVLVEDKEVAAKFPRQKDKLTVLLLDEQGKITNIRYVAPGDELQTLLSGDGK